jgi:hypothetical protein
MTACACAFSADRRTSASRRTPSRTFGHQQTWNLLGFNGVEIDSYETQNVEETAWGFHVGGDVTWFFTRVFRIGGFARLSRREVTVEDPDIPADGPVDVKVGDPGWSRAAVSFLNE